MSELLPDGVSDLRDAPHALIAGLGRALLILSFEELPKDERPPRRAWSDDEALADHFKGVERRREQEFKGKAIDDPVDNDAASMLIVED